ncbi:hypothetical protein PR202_ga04331 [Eleusine coracana subsp. coracana]|uniref:Uncharacterized protein n=1 Tax=Eleusine coracana subsp. coracana TaxID=191504 RepID=A0AAV5BQM8_ELECO|nr:hypothetical protein PR202_ga04331 [Eleusine coracana subsp. coracana]
MLDKEDRTRMLPKSSGQKTLRAAMQEERATLASRLLYSPDASVSNPSFRVYYGVASAGSVPFLWESAPGTPKNTISDTKLPPLTPPPSFYNNNKATKTKFVKSQSSKEAAVLFQAGQLRAKHHPQAACVGVTPMPARSSSSSVPPPSKDRVQCNRRNRLLASPRSSFSSTSRGDDEEEGVGESSPTSTLCFRARHSSSGAGRMHGLLASVMRG